MDITAAAAAPGSASAAGTAAATPTGGTPSGRGQTSAPAAAVDLAENDEFEEDDEGDDEDDKAGDKEGEDADADASATGENGDGNNMADSRGEKARQDEAAGVIEFRVIENDGKKDSLILLTGAKNIFQKQLPKMPKEYITRLVYDRKHRTMVIVRNRTKVIGAITYRPFDEREFGEIVFCAIHSDNQVKGYGSLLMNHLKIHVINLGHIKHFLTYADNYAIGYFKKQGFTADITLDKSIWVGYIKDYDGGTLMQCTLVPKIDYLRVRDILEQQRQAIQQRIEEMTRNKVVHPGLKVFRQGTAAIPVESIPGLLEAGWTPEMSRSKRAARDSLYSMLHSLFTAVKQHGSSWPFREPVKKDEVEDYYDVIKNPMDLQTMERRLQSRYYSDLDGFVADMQLIFDNCRLYNQENTPYYKCANTLERDFQTMLKELPRP